MKTGTKFKKYFYETLEEVTVADDVLFESLATARTSVYEGVFDKDFKYATSETMLYDRVLLTGVTFPNSIIYKDNLVITGIPADCYCRIDGVLNEGDISLSTVMTKEINIIFVGKYRYPPVTITVINPVEDARNADTKWQAIENATPAQIENWINSNITDLASARNLLKTLVLAIRYLHDRND